MEARAFLDLQGGHTGDFVDVDDNDAVGTPITLGSNSVIGANTMYWSLVPLVPLLSPVALGLLALALVVAARHRVRDPGTHASTR